MIKAAPQLVYVRGKESSGNQVLFDFSGRKIGELVNRRILKATNRAHWFLLQVIDPLPNFFPARISTMLYSFISKGVGFIIPRRVRIRLCLWNPVTLQSIDLPVVEFESGYCIRCVLLTTINPNDPQSCVFLILNKYILFCHVDNSGEEEGDHGWTRMDYPDNFFYHHDERYKQCQSFAVMYNKDTIIVRTYLRSNSPIASIQIKELKSSVIMPGSLKIPLTHSTGCEHRLIHRSHWISCCGKLFVIHVYFAGVWGWDEIIGVIVFQQNSDMSWDILGTCPNAAFFTNGNEQALWHPTSKPEVANRVYMIHRNVRTNRLFLYTYHIENKTLSRSLLPSRSYWMPIPVERHANGETNNGNNGEHVSMLPSGETNNGEQVSNGETNNGEDVSLLGVMLNVLPADLLNAISSHMSNPVDYLNIRATNRLFRSVGSAKEWRSILTTSERIGMCPWLMIPSVVDKGVSVMVDPVSGNKYYLNTCWSHDYSRIMYSSDGWLLMLTDFRIAGKRRVKLWLYNPITKHTVRLPERDYLDRFMIISSNESRNCRVVGMSVYRRDFYFIELDWNQSDWEYEWNRGEIYGDYSIVNQSNINPACVEGKYYYFLVQDGDLASLVYDNDENRFHLTIHRLKLPCTDFFEQRFVVAGYDNIVLAIYVGKEGKSLRVFEFNRSKVVMEWLEVQDLRNHNVYLSTVMCICKQAELPGKGNRIYLPRFHHGHIVYYCLATRKFHAGEGDSSAVSHYGSEEQLYSSWFEPRPALKL